ncbi:MAG: phosphoglucomutase/phosphomannomutase family protein [Acidobacteriota bacterium]
MIHFGTAGWRGIIGDEFTFHNVRLVTQAIVDHLLSADASRSLVVGYDTRFLSEKFASEAAKVLSQNGIRAMVCDRDVPTPTISFCILGAGAGGGLNFTASHNPPEYNGLKFSDRSGAPALPDTTAAIEARIREREADFVDEYFQDDAHVERIDPSGPYLEHVASLIDLQAIADSGLRVAVDSLYGTGRDYLDRLLIEAGVECDVLHNFRDPYFGGYSPQSTEENLGELKRRVASAGFDLGLATDNDCDRFAIVDSDGSWLNPNDVLGLVAHYVLTERGPVGDLGRTVSTTHLLDRIADWHGVRVHETPVGFKYIGDLLRRDQIVMGGEESAGLSIAGHLPEKDGILACLLVAELAARFGTPLRQHLESLREKVGRSVHERLDYRITPEIEAEVLERLDAAPDELAGTPVSSVSRTDGTKLHFEDGSRFLYRRSGTEPMIRCYAEAANTGRTRQLHDAGRRFLFRPSSPGDRPAAQSAGPADEARDARDAERHDAPD